MSHVHTYVNKQADKWHTDRERESEGADKWVFSKYLSNEWNSSRDSDKSFRRQRFVSLLLIVTQREMWPYRASTLLRVGYVTPYCPLSISALSRPACSALSFFIYIFLVTCLLRNPTQNFYRRKNFRSRCDLTGVGTGRALCDPEFFFPNFANCFRLKTRWKYNITKTCAVLASRKRTSWLWRRTKGVCWAATEWLDPDNAGYA